MRVEGDAHVLPTDRTVVTVAKGTHLCDPPLRGRVVWDSPSFKAELLYPSTPTTLDNTRLKTEGGRMKMLEDRRTRGSRQRMSGGAGSFVSHSLLKRVGAVFHLFDRHADFEHRIKTFESRQQDWET